MAPTEDSASTSVLTTCFQCQVNLSTTKAANTMTTHCESSVRECPDLLDGYDLEAFTYSESPRRWVCLQCDFLLCTDCFPESVGDVLSLCLQGANEEVQCEVYATASPIQSTDTVLYSVSFGSVLDVINCTSDLYYRLADGSGYVLRKPPIDVPYDRFETVDGHRAGRWHWQNVTMKRYVMHFDEAQEYEDEVHSDARDYEVEDSENDGAQQTSRKKVKVSKRQSCGPLKSNLDFTLNSLMSGDLRHNCLREITASHDCAKLFATLITKSFALDDCRRNQILCGHNDAKAEDALQLQLFEAAILLFKKVIKSSQSFAVALTILFNLRPPARVRNITNKRIICTSIRVER
jgi:hypothetical protein